MVVRCTNGWRGVEMSKEQPAILARPENRGSVQSNKMPEPWQMDPELAQHKMAELMVNKLGTPSVVTKEFVVRYGMFKAINHADPIIEFSDDHKTIISVTGNPTGYDCSLRLKLYRNVANESVNVDGVYFHNFWAYMMKPKYVINGMQLGQQEEQKESIIGRVMKWFSGGKKNDQSQQ
jgi:hypothetical protein